MPPSGPQDLDGSGRLDRLRMHTGILCVRWKTRTPGLTSFGERSSEGDGRISLANPRINSGSLNSVLRPRTRVDETLDVRLDRISSCAITLVLRYVVPGICLA